MLLVRVLTVSSGAQGRPPLFRLLCVHAPLFSRRSPPPLLFCFAFPFSERKADILLTASATHCRSISHAQVLRSRCAVFGGLREVGVVLAAAAANLSARHDGCSRREAVRLP